LIIVYGQDALVGEWASKTLGREIVPPFVTMGFSRDGQNLHGAAVFNDWNGSNLEITIIGPGCLTRGNIRAVYSYVFGQIRANRLTAKTARNNKRMLRLLPRLGFTWESVAKRYFGPEKRNDAIVFALFRENAEKWYEHAIRAAAA